ncbi:MAG: 6-phosphofructokinase [Eubacteriales bacterium]|nr:6-phosphofructokinase [Eubacteriales bacterium]
MKNVLVGQSGGPTAVINASLYGVVTEALSHKEDIGHVYGMLHGIEGFLQDRYMDMGAVLSPDELELLKLTPAAYLGSCRYKLPEDLTSPVYKTIFEKFAALDIGYFFYIGGNDSMDTVSKLSRYAAGTDSTIRFIGIPKTIDNDLIQTDHTPGYGSAAKYVASTVREIVLDATVYKQKAVTIIELMGRHAGWLTAASVLARKNPHDNPMLIYLPEAPFEMEQFAHDLQSALEKRNCVIVCVSEGIADRSGTFICEYGDEAAVDNFGHKMLTGCGKVLENFVRNRFGVKVRSVELNVSQRCSGMVASKTDIEEASSAGAAGIKAALSGENGRMIAFVRTSAPGEPYHMECRTVDVNEVCNQEKPVPLEWITKGGSDISDDFAEYALPLIQGEARRIMKDGLPVYLFRDAD